MKLLKKDVLIMLGLKYMLLKMNIIIWQRIKVLDLWKWAHLFLNNIPKTFLTIQNHILIKEDLCTMAIIKYLSLPPSLQRGQ